MLRSWLVELPCGPWAGRGRVRRRSLQTETSWRSHTGSVDRPKFRANGRKVHPHRTQHEALRDCAKGTPKKGKIGLQACGMLGPVPTPLGAERSLCQVIS